METTVAVQEQELKQQALSVVEQAKIVKITDQESYTDACVLLLDHIKPLRKRWADYWKGNDAHPGPVKLAYSAYKSVLEKFTQGDEPLERAESQVKAEVARWDQAQEEIRRELQEKVQREAEAAAQAEIDKQAVFAELSGADAEQVAAIAAQPIAVVAPPVLPTYEKASGVSTRSKWIAVVTDIKKLALAVAKGQAPTTYLIPNQSALDARARADQITLNLPGVVAREEKIVAGRTR